jgi:predicted amidohydrolase YtcJ
MTTAPTRDVLLRRVQVGLGGPVCDVRLAGGVVAAVQATGSDPDGAEVVDGRGGTLLPGMRDRHVHMSQWAVALQRIDLSAAVSAADAIRITAEVDRARTGPTPDVVNGYGFRDGLWPDTPHKDLLEQAFPGRAVALVSNDLHSIWLSPAALALIGVSHPTGLLREDECFDATAKLPEFGDEAVDAFAIEAARHAAGRGVTEILDFECCDTVATWTRRHRLAGTLPIRVIAAVRRPLLDTAIDAGWHSGDVVPGTDGLVTVGPCKVLMDGSLNTRTALCHHAYPGVTDQAEAHGMLTQDPEELTEAIRRAARAGISFAVHAIGDRANTLALDCFQAAGCGGRIEHAQLVGDEDLPRFAQLGVIAGVQPGHAAEDRDIADALWAGRTGMAFPFGALLKAGATLELGSDAPVSRLDPWHAIASAVTRTNDGRPGWHPEQSLTVAQAVAASTGGRTAPAVGMVADLVLTDRDPAEVPPAELREIGVLATLVGGRFTHRTV